MLAAVSVSLACESAVLYGCRSCEACVCQDVRSSADAMSGMELSCWLWTGAGHTCVEACDGAERISDDDQICYTRPPQVEQKDS